MKHLKAPSYAAFALALGLGVISIASAQTMDSQSQGMPPGSPKTGMNDPNSFANWSNDYSRTHNGRISRQAYMNEAGRRWDAMDKNGQGLTASDVNQMYGPSMQENQKRGSKGG